MRTTWCLVAALALTHSPVGQAAGGESFIIGNVLVFDPQAGAFGEPTDIVVRDDRIRSVGSATAFDPSVPRIDGKGSFAVAGLWDSHTHLSFLTLGGDEGAARGLQAFLHKGITSVRDLGGPLGTIDVLSRRVAEGRLAGPRVHFAGPLVSEPPLLAHLARINGMLPGNAVTVASVEELDGLLDDLVERGAVMAKAIDPWDPAFFRYLVEAAGARGLRVVVDPGMTVFHRTPVDLVLAFGVTSIEHAKAAWPLVLRDDLKREHDAFMAGGRPIDEGEELMIRIMAFGAASVSRDRLRRLAELWAGDQAYLCPTLLPSHRWADNPPPMPERLKGTESAALWRASFAGFHQANRLFVRALADAGVRMLVGQDGADPTALFDEMELLSRSGVAPAEILRGATVYPAVWLGVDADFGSISAGKVADFVLLERDPLKDISNIRSTLMVVQNGVIVRDLEDDVD